MLDIPETQPAQPISPRRRIDWREAAALLARGHTVGEVAARLDCRAAAIRRNLARSERFRNWIAAEQAGLAELSRRRLATLMLKLPDAVEAAMEKGNASVLKWLADHLVRGELGLDTRLWDPLPPPGEDDEESDDLPGSIDTAPADAFPEDAAAEAEEGEDEDGDDTPILPADRPLPFLHRQLLHLVEMPSAGLPLPPSYPPEASADEGGAAAGAGSRRPPRPELAETGAEPAKAGREPASPGSNWRELAALGRA